MALTKKEIENRSKAFTVKSKDKAIVAKLPAKLHRIAFGILDKNEKGKDLSWEEAREQRREVSAPMDALTKADRMRIFKALRPSLAADIEETWQFMHSLPVKLYMYRHQPFRSPNDPEFSLAKRIDWLCRFLNATSAISEKVLTPEWLAAWVIPLETEVLQGHFDAAWPFLACVINQGGKRAEAIVDILIQSGNREHEIGDMGSHVPNILLMANHPRGWEYVEKLLIAAQRQEGLRQSILSAIPTADPGAAKRMYRVLVENRMARFSSTAQFLSSPLGYSWDSSSTGVINKVLTTMADLIGDPSACKKALNGDDPENAHFAFWAIGKGDLQKLTAPIKKLLSHKDVEMRFVAADVLGRMGQGSESLNVLRATAYQDDDLRVAFAALPEYLVSYEEKKTESESHSKKLFEALEKLVERASEKGPTTLEPLVWPWRTEINPELVGSVMLSKAYSVPADRLISTLPKLPVECQAEAIRIMAKSEKWSDELRKTIIEAIGNKWGLVSYRAAEAFGERKLRDQEAIDLEKILTRKATVIRETVIKMLRQQAADQQVESAERLLAGNAQQRLGGLEVIRQLVDSKESQNSMGCHELIQSWSTGRKKLSKEEASQVKYILDLAKPGLTLENGLGCFDPKKLTPGERPKSKKIPLVTKATMNLINALQALVKKHGKEIVTYTGSNGETEGPFLSAFIYIPDSKLSYRKQKKNLPLADVWTEWFDNRPKNCRDKDGMELVRVNTLLQNWDGLWLDRLDLVETMKDFPKLTKTITGFDKKSKLPEGLSQVFMIFNWLEFINPVAKREQFKLGALEYICTQVSDSHIARLATAKFKKTQHSDRKDFREIDVVTAWFPDFDLEKLPKAILERYWRVLNWFDKPTEGAVRQRPSYPLTVRAYQQKLASFDDVADQLIGEREDCWSHYGFEMLRELTVRKPDAASRKILAKTKKLPELIESVTERLMETELNRGQNPTIATAPSGHLGAVFGIENLIRILTMLGKEKFKQSHCRRENASKAHALTALAGKTYPQSGDTQASFDKQIKAAIKEAAFPAERVLELAFHAPQWAQFVQGHLKWKGMTEATYWFHAHMSYWGHDKDAVVAGTEYDEELDDQNQNQATESAWNRFILERTSLTNEQRAEGLIDVQWFHKVHSELGAKRFDELAAAARYGATPAAAKKAKYIAEVLTGRAEPKELFEKIETRKLKEHVRLLGLLPLPKAASKREKAILERYSVLMDYQKYARGLSSLSRPDALRAAEIGLENMARTAGFDDPMRMQWALEAESTKDLKAGYLEAKKDNVLVRMDLDPRGLPVTTVQKEGKILKSIPVKYRKEPKFVAIRERAKQLKTQGIRIRRSLESAMIRGDEIDAKELKQLSKHTILWPMLSRLILVGDGIMGYPDKSGKALRDFKGKLEPIKSKETLRVAHPYELLKSKKWSQWQRECFESERIQPFKQIFRELYVVSAQEKKDKTVSRRYAGQQVQPGQASALWTARGWQQTDYEVWKSFPDLGINVNVEFEDGWESPVEVDDLTIESLQFHSREKSKPLKLTEVPPVLFSEVMRDMDLVVSVAHRGEVDPEASASTVEMRIKLIEETSKFLGIKNVKIKKNHAMIEGQHGSYSLHLGSGVVHRLPGGHVCIVPVHSQHRGRVFLPFADDDPKTAEIVSKILLLSRDDEIQDPTVLDQLRAATG